MGKCASSWVDLEYTYHSYTSFLRWHQCSSLVVTVFLGVIFSYIRAIEVPYIFDWEHRNPQDEMQGNRASLYGEGEVSWVFSNCGRHLVYILELRLGCPFETGVCSVKSVHLSRFEGQIRNINWHGRTIRTLLEFKWEFRSLFLFDTVILGFLTIIKICQASSKFEAVNSTRLSSCQSHVRPLCEMKRRPRAFCRLSTADSDILSSCDMNDEHAWSLCRETWTSV